MKFLDPLTGGQDATLGVVTETSQILGTYVVDRVFTQSFVDAVANQKTDLYFTTFWGRLDVTLSATRASANAGGSITKSFFLGLISPNFIYSNVSRYSETSASTGANFAISDLTWDATNSRFRIQIVHRTSTGNPVYVHVHAVAAATTSATEIATNMGITAVYTTDTTTFALPVVTFPDAVSMGANLTLTGAASTISMPGAGSVITMGGATSDPVLALASGTGHSAVMSYTWNSASVWYLYNAGTANLYLRDIANTKMHASFIAGAGAGGGSTDFNTAVTVAGTLGITGNTTMAAISHVVPQGTGTGRYRRYENVCGWSSQNATDTGAIVFIAPYGFSNTMQTHEISGIDFLSTTGAFRLRVSFYDFTTGPVAYFPSVEYLSDLKPTVQVGREISTGHVVIILGGVGSVWKYAKAQITTSYVGYVSPGDAYQSGWTSTIVTSLAAYDVLTTPPNYSLSGTGSRHDALLAHLAGTETFTGAKTFSGGIAGNLAVAGTLNSGGNLTENGVRVHSANYGLATTVVSGTAYGLSTVVGTGGSFAREDHSHGSVKGYSPRSYARVNFR